MTDVFYTVNMNCLTCMYFKKKTEEAHLGLCTRYPLTQNKKIDDHCDEWVDRWA